MDSEKFYKAQCEHAIQSGKVTATEYRHGAVVNGWPSRWPLSSNTQKGKRDIIRSMSARSMIRAAFQVANSPTDFDLMTTLTFRTAHDNPKECLRQFCVQLKLNTHPLVGWGWFMEFQARPMVHFHVIHTWTQLQRHWGHLPHTWVTYPRKGKERTVLQGALGQRIQDIWIGCVRDPSSEFLRFQRGGITEKLTSPELTGRYMGGYLSKAAQKLLPGTEAPQGRWWWLNEAARPQAGRTVVLDAWPLDRPHKLVHDKGKLGLGVSADKSSQKPKQGLEFQKTATDMDHVLPPGSSRPRARPALKLRRASDDAQGRGQ